MAFFPYHPRAFAVIIASTDFRLRALKLSAVLCVSNLGSQLLEFSEDIDLRDVPD